MKKSDAKEMILKEWDNWSKTPDVRDYNEMSMFYLWLKKNKPELLTWRIGAGIDRWQDVQGWLNVRTGFAK